MGMHTRVLLLISGTFLFTVFVLNECEKLDGYKFPVYSTPFCPRNESEWNKKSSAINCNETNGYTCLPNEKLTELLEFCYTQPWLLIEEGYCLYLERKGSYVDSYSCRHFRYGCHNTSYLSIRIYEHPACISLGNGCFLAEQSCKSSPKTTHRPKSTDDDKDDWLWVVILIGIMILIGIIVLIVCVSLMLYLYHKKISPDIESAIKSHEKAPLIKNAENEKNDSSNRESQTGKAIFDQWKQEDSCFISTMACKEVEKQIKRRNLVIVAGPSGSGKSAIIQHIALKYLELGWTVKRVKNVKDIVYSSSRNQKNNTICVFNDPIGKESFDEILNNSWQTYQEEVKLYLQTAKLVMSCRRHVICDTRVTRDLVNQSHIVNIDDNKYKLSVEEKRQILTRYTSYMNLSEKECDEIVAVEKYFPLLCKLYSSKVMKNNGIRIFIEPVTVVKEVITKFRLNNKGKYCALALLVLFNDDLCLSDLLKNKENTYKFKRTLKLCGLPKNTPPLDIGDYLNSIKDFFVKKVDDTYHFYHDFVMEVTTLVFGKNYPSETVKYADVGFLRRKVRLGYCEEYNDSFTIYLNDRYIEELGERLYSELFGNHLLDVVLNPCLRNEKVIEVLKKNIAHHPEHLQMLLETKELTIDKHLLDRTSKSVLMSKLEFLVWNNEVSPLFALIVFCHTQLSQYCIDTLPQKQIDLRSCFLIYAMCCNGSIDLFDTVFKNYTEESLKRARKGLYPIHIVSAFQKYELLDKFIMKGININQKADDDFGGWTPLMLAAGNDTQEYGDNNLGESGKERREKTVQLLLSNGADINMCSKDGTSPLYIACQNGHDSTVQLLLSNGADINLCKENGASPLFIACQNGHESTVRHLLSNKADINSCGEEGANPLYIACQNGHDSTVQLLLNNGADTNLCKENGASPLFVASENGYDSTVQLLLSNGAYINLCMKNGTSPLLIACQNGHDSTVQLLRSNGADINSFFQKILRNVRMSLFK